MITFYLFLKTQWGNTKLAADNRKKNLVTVQSNLQELDQQTEEILIWINSIEAKLRAANGEQAKVRYRYKLFICSGRYNQQ